MSRERLRIFNSLFIRVARQGHPAPRLTADPVPPPALEFDLSEFDPSNDDDRIIDDDTSALEERGWLCSEISSRCPFYLPPAKVEWRWWGGVLANSRGRGDSTRIEDIIGRAGTGSGLNHEDTKDLQGDKEANQNNTKTGEKTRNRWRWKARIDSKW